MKRSIQVLAFAAALTGAPPAFAQAPPNPAEAAAALIVITMIPPANSAPLKVSSPAFKDGGDIPFENTQYRGNVFPGLQWSKGPAGTKSYAVIMQDADGVAKGDAILHWTMYDIGPDTRMLAPGMSAPPPGAMAGPNIRGPNMAYMGPKTPAGPKHRYHLQVFALDTVLPPDPTLTWAGLKAALAGHVLASGQTIGLGQVDPTAPAPKPQ